jgi:membrane protein
MIKLQRILIESRPVKTVINWSKKLILPGFEGLPLYDVLHFFFKQTQQIGLNERAASVAFNFLMAVPPLFIFIFTLLSYIPGSKRLYEEILILLRGVIPDGTTYTMIKNVMDDFFATGTGTLSFGLLLALYFSSNATLTIMRTFRKSMLHIEVEERNFIEVRLSAIRLTFIIVLLIIATIMIMLTQTIILNWIIEQMKIKDSIIDFIFGSGQFVVTFLLIFLTLKLPTITNTVRSVVYLFFLNFIKSSLRTKERKEKIIRLFNVDRKEK